MELVTANGEIIHCDGEVDIDFQLGEFKGCFPVLLVNNFKFNCLIGNDMGECSSGFWSQNTDSWWQSKSSI